MTTYTYTTGASSDVRGCCGHKHRSVEAAKRCLENDARACRQRGGYSDRTRIVRSDGLWNTAVGLELGDEWRE